MSEKRTGLLQSKKGPKLPWNKSPGDQNAWERFFCATSLGGVCVRGVFFSVTALTVVASVTLAYQYSEFGLFGSCPNSCSHNTSWVP